MTTSTKNSMTSYFILFDFYHNRKTTEAFDHYFLESIIYFYPNQEEIKIQKEPEWRLLVGLMQCLKNDLFSTYPKEIFHRNSLIKIKHYGRHCAFLILPRDRFSMDEADIHLEHILQLYHILYGSFNHVQTTHSNIEEIAVYLRQTMTPIIEHVFNEERSIRNLFSVIDYSPLRKGYQLSILDVKHFLYRLQNAYQIQDGLIACEKRILYSTFDIETTYYIQAILDSTRLSYLFEPSNTIKIAGKLNKGVALIMIHLIQSSDSESDLTTTTTTNNITTDYVDEPIQINSAVYLDTLEQPILPQANTITNNKIPSETSKIDFHSDQMISSDDITDPDTDHTGYTSTQSKTDETDSLLSYGNRKTIFAYGKNCDPIYSYNSNEKSIIDLEKDVYSHSEASNHHLEKSTQPVTSLLNSKDNSDRMMFQTMICDLEVDDSIDCQPDDILLLPKTIHPDYPQLRRRTITNAANESETQNKNNSHDSSMTWQNIPENNNESEREEFILYIQQNSRLTFAGLIKQRTLSESYLQELWFLLLTRMAVFDQDIQVIPFAGKINGPNVDIKFQFNKYMHQAQYERLMNQNRFYYKVPSSEGACMALNGRNKLLMNPERQGIGISQGNNSMSITHNLPHREMYSWRQVQEFR